LASARFVSFFPQTEYRSPPECQGPNLYDKPLVASPTSEAPLSPSPIRLGNPLPAPAEHPCPPPSFSFSDAKGDAPPLERIFPFPPLSRLRPHFLLEPEYEETSLRSLRFMPRRPPPLLVLKVFFFPPGCSLLPRKSSFPSYFFPFLRTLIQGQSCRLF